MNGRSRENILREIRRGLHRDTERMDAGDTSRRTDTVLQKVAEIRKRYAINNNNGLLEQLVKELSNVNAEVYRAQTEDEISEYIRSVIRRKGIKSFVAWETDNFNSAGLSSLLEGEGLTHIKSNDKYEIAHAGMGLTGVDYAISDTGTLVLLTDGNKPRGVSLIPPIHLAIVRESDIVRDINDLFVILKQKLDAGERVPNCMTFITGPSRTADIELNLTLGVHGPKELHVIIT